MNQKKKNQHLIPLVLVTSLFFLWAITANLLPILIPHLKKACKLNVLQSSLIDSAYWIAYFAVAIPAGLVMKRFGYKVSIIVGLLLAGVGAFLFYPAAESRTFSFFLLALFIVASGMTFLETSANPFITVLGSPESASRRLNFAQAFNGLGAVIATNFISHAILSDNVKTGEELKSMSAAKLNSYYESLFHTLKMPYIVIGLVLIIVAIMFMFTTFQKTEQPAEKDKNNGGLNPFKFPNLAWGISAQFFYVGAQVCVSSFFILYAKNTAGLTEKEAATYLGILLISFMLGRYIGAFLMKKYSPAGMLILYTLINIFLMGVIVLIGGKVSLYAFMGVEFFMSIMYPTIFSFAIKNLGNKTHMASSYMVMAIIGGAIFPPLLGVVYDHTQSMQLAYLVPLLCFVPVLYYGIRCRQLTV
jgi:FHS family L-fucose permease-like MFS transporter